MPNLCGKSAEGWRPAKRNFVIWEYPRRRAAPLWPRPTNIGPRRSEKTREPCVIGSYMTCSSYVCYVLRAGARKPAQYDAASYMWILLTVGSGKERNLRGRSDQPADIWTQKPTTKNRRARDQSLSRASTPRRPSPRVASTRATPLVCIPWRFLGASCHKTPIPC
jgi:hypothetical protein